MIEENNYIPIECGLHSEYEVAIMSNKIYILTWIDSNKITQKQTIKPIDIITHNKQEFLKIKTMDNSIYNIRLDKIVEILPT